MAGKSRVNEKVLRDLHSKGMDPGEIAKEMGFSRSAIEMRLHIFGLKWIKKKGGHPETPMDTQLAIIAENAKGEIGATLIGRKYGIDKGTVYNILKRHNKGTRSTKSRRKIVSNNNKGEKRKHRVTDNDRVIKKLHEEGLCITEIVNNSGFSDPGVRYSLSKQGLYEQEDRSLAMRQKLKKRVDRPWVVDTELREDIFDILDPVSCYWLGFFQADLNIFDPKMNNKGCLITLRQKRGSRYLLEELKEWINTSRAITDGTHHSFGKDREHSVLAWTSRRMATRLGELGIRRHKEGRFIPPIVQNSPDFWRGLVDGDGSVYSVKKGNLYLSGQMPIMDKWVEFCESIAYPNCVTIREQPGVFVGSVRFKDATKTILEALYKRGEGVAHPVITSKLDKAKTWFNYIPISIHSP